MKSAAKEVVEKVCNCSQCGIELHSLWKGGICLTSQVAGRAGGKPYCKCCIQPRCPPPGRYGPTDDAGPGWDNMIRAMEG